MKRDFADRVVVITGAGGAIGRATALAFARAGARLHVVDQRIDRVEETREACRQQRAEVTSHALDCTDRTAVDELAAWIFEQEGRIDVLQNGVGVLVAGPLEDLGGDDWRRALDTNLWSVIHGVDAFLPYLRQARGAGPAQLINIACWSGLVGFPLAAPYVTAKFAVVGLGEALSAELDPRQVRVTTVCPGLVQGRFLRDGVLRLPEPWKSALEQAYRSWALRPELLARQILAAVRHGQPLVVPRFGPAPSYLLKRLFGPRYPRWAHGFWERIIR